MPGTSQTQALKCVIWMKLARVWSYTFGLPCGSWGGRDFSDDIRKNEALFSDTCNACLFEKSRECLALHHFHRPLHSWPDSRNECLKAYKKFTFICIYQLFYFLSNSTHARQYMQYFNWYLYKWTIILNERNMAFRNKNTYSCKSS